MLIRYLIGRGTMDEGLISMIHRKQSTLRSTVGEKEPPKGGKQDAETIQGFVSNHYVV